MPAHNSTHERRHWRDRLRRLLGHEDRTTSSELITRNGEPAVLVVTRGEPVGYRCRDGSVMKFPERPLRQEELDREPETEWVQVGGRWRETFR